MVAGWGSFTVDGFGYFLTWLNNMAQASKSVAASQLNGDKSLTTFDTLFFFACVGLPFSLAMNLYCGEFDKFDLALKA